MYVELSEQPAQGRSLRGRRRRLSSIKRREGRRVRKAKLVVKAQNDGREAKDSSFDRRGRLGVILRLAFEERQGVSVCQARVAVILQRWVWRSSLFRCCSERGDELFKVASLLVLWRQEVEE